MLMLIHLDLALALKTNVSDKQLRALDSLAVRADK